ncbi:thioesterase [Russula brevipes]|nr:thioesterase [Russula brevipes]
MGPKPSEPAPRSALKARTRTDYKYFLSYRTRWSDNDQYSHVNNAVYYHLFDSVINAYLIAHCGLSPRTSDAIGLVVSSYCHFFSPLSFPDSSVTYEVGVFREGSAEPAAVGGYTHVFVDAVSRKTSRMRDRTREGLQKLFIPSSSESGSKL